MDVQQDSREAVFAGSVNRLRERKGWTQTDLAREMKERGFPFHQQTIQRIEDGKRPVRLDEAYALAELLDSEIDSMSRSMEGWRRTEARGLLWGVLSLTSGAWRATGEMFDNSHQMASHVSSLLDNGERSDRALAGLALLTELVRVDDALPDTTRTLVGPFADAVFIGDRVLPEVTLTPDERFVRAVVGKHRVPARFKAMSVADLVEIYSPGFWESRAD
ncbi:helix-turn-helix transcriptional regulator [Segeticoccus rhizosphaerae]|uniref:helix-turn-helix transcriptional regulator n=1 Tax=Segeticoccus rhizosphaerae TaxID=1104777 RepID=UPI001EE48D65|nr:helix-turn-helix transcriptional regulator [Ornithinicoccus soli]